MWPPPQASGREFRREPLSGGGFVVAGVGRVTGRRVCLRIRVRAVALGCALRVRRPARALAAPAAPRAPPLRRLLALRLLRAVGVVLALAVVGAVGTVRV